jgi:hypothetical protein
MTTDAARRLERVVLAAIAVLLSLLATGWALAHGATPWPAVAVLLGCAALTRLALRWPGLGASTPSIAAWFGVAAALVFVPSIWIEYVGRTVDNRLLTVTILSLWTTAGVVATRASGRVRDATIASTVSAILSTVVFLIAVLGAYDVLRGSALQDVFFRTEGTYDDFRHSGGADLATFVIDDMFGGVFFHLLFGTLIASGVGSAGGAATATILRLRRRRAAA